MAKQISKDTSNKIVWANFIGCLLIILLHSTRYKYFEVSESCKMILNAIALYLPEMGVPLFFVLSGFLMYRDTNIDTKNIMPVYKEKIKKRFFSLMVPYFIFNIIWMVFTILEQNIPYVNNHINSAVHFSYSLQDILAGVFFFKFNGVAWYLFCLMGYSLLFPFIFWIEKNHGGILLLFFSCIISCTNLFEGSIIGYISQFNSLFFYILGVHLSFLKYDFVNKNYNKKQRLLSIIILCSTVAVLMNVPHDNIFCNNFILAFVRLVGVICIWCLIDVIKNYHAPWEIRITFFVYLMHSEIQKCINKICELLLPHKGNIYAIINTVIGVLGTYFIVIIIAYIIMRYCPQIWKLLNGGRIQINANKK